MMNRLLPLAASLALLLQPLFAADGAGNSLSKEEMQQISDGLDYRQGEISLGDGYAKITVPDAFRFLDSADTEKVLTQLWGNPPREKKPLGMILPAGVTPLDASCWAVVVTYNDDGYVKDADADKIDYTKMLQEMQEATRKNNEERVKQGYLPIELVGWAAPPRYDAVTHKLYWAKDLKFGDGSRGDTLNYDIRVLGRHGVLVLTAIAQLDQLSEIDQAAPQLLQMVDFTDGNRYADYRPGTDKLATYGLAALVAGGVAAKLGFFKLLWVGLLALKKFIVIGAVAVSAWVKKFFARKKQLPPPS